MGNVHMEAAQINYRGGEKKMSVEEALKNTSGEAAAIAQLQQDVSDLNDVKSNKITIAPAFSAEASYDPGDLVYYNGLTYRCVNEHSGEWEADDFAATTIDNELSELRSGLIGVGHVRMENVTLTGGEPGTDGEFTIANFGIGTPVIIQIADNVGAKGLLPTNWWVADGTLHVQYTILPGSAYIGGVVSVRMVV